MGGGGVGFGFDVSCVCVRCGEVRPVPKGAERLLTVPTDRQQGKWEAFADGVAPCGCGARRVRVVLDVCLV
jgi:hypothetical protein